MPKRENRVRGAEEKKAPKYRRHSCGQARVTIAGRDIYLGKWGSAESKKAYHRVIAEWRASNNSGLFGLSTEQISISQLLLEYFRYCRKHRKTGENSEFRRFRPIAKALKDLYGTMVAAEFRPLHAKAVIEHFRDSKDLSRPYVAKMLSRLKQFFAWAAQENLIPAEVAQAVRNVPTEKMGRSRLREPDPVQPVEWAMVEATLPHLSQVVADMVRFNWFVGCRPGEVCSLTPGMIDRSGDVWEARLPEHKTAWCGKERVLYIAKEGQKVLEKYLDRDPSLPCFSPKDARREHLTKRRQERITPANQGNNPGSNRKKKPAKKDGSRYSSGSYARAIARACEKAFPCPSSIKSTAKREQWRRDHSWSPNQLRHAFATKVRSEYGLDVCQVLLGHSTVAVTQIYAQADRSKAVEAMRKMSQ